MRLRLRLDMTALDWGAPDQQPTDRCSVCQTPFKEDDVPLCTWSSEGWAARFCDACADKYIEVEKSP